jgi:hypothetical protein
MVSTHFQLGLDRNNPDSPLAPCDVHDNCLECPLPECKYDNEPAYIEWYRQNKLDHRSPTQLYFYDARAMKDIAAREGVHTLTLYRLINEGKIQLRTHKQLMKELRCGGISTRRIAGMIKRGDIRRMPATVFPPINLPGFKGYVLPIQATEAA